MPVHTHTLSLSLSLSLSIYLSPGTYYSKYRDGQTVGTIGVEDGGKPSTMHFTAAIALLLRQNLWSPRNFTT